MTRDLLKRLGGSLLALAIFFVLCCGLVGLSATPAIAGGVVGVLAFLLVTHGATTIIVDSTVAAPFLELAGKIPVVGPGIYREDPDGTNHGLLACSMCTGMWVGAIVAGLGISLWPTDTGWLGVRDLAFHGAASSAWCFAAHLLVEKVKS